MCHSTVLAVGNGFVLKMTETVYRFARGPPGRRQGS